MLDQDITYLPGVGPHRKEILSKELNIHTFGDLLEYYPYKYVDRSRLYRIADLQGTQPFVQIKGQILSFEEFVMGVRKKRIVAHFTDGIKFEAVIFNRWGQKLYSWTDPAGGWDGKFNGKDVKQGVYYVMVKAVGADGKKYNIKRDVNLLRGFTERTTP